MLEKEKEVCLDSRLYRMCRHNPLKKKLAVSVPSSVGRTEIDYRYLVEEFMTMIRDCVTIRLRLFKGSSDSVKANTGRYESEVVNVKKVL